MTWTLDRFDLDGFVRATLAEDMGEGGDITAAAVIPKAARFAGVMESRDAIIVAGLPIAEAFFRALDPEAAIERLVEDGAAVAAATPMSFVSARDGRQYVVIAAGGHSKSGTRRGDQIVAFALPAAGG